MNNFKALVQPKVRESNLELYRIIVMFMIVAHHYVVNSGLMDVMKEAPTSPNSIFFYLFAIAEFEYRHSVTFSPSMTTLFTVPFPSAITLLLAST